MIRELRKVDINKVAEIWLDTNIKTHYFISAQYWKSNFELVKELLLQATVYVYEDKQEIQGFIGLSNEYIEGIFAKLCKGKKKQINLKCISKKYTGNILLSKRRI